MMKTLLAIVAVLMLYSCNSKPEGDPRVEEIKKMEAELSDDVSLDTAMATKITDAYISYAEDNPQDSLAPWYLFKAADILKEIRLEWLRAVNVYAKVHHDYPEHPLAAKAVFMIGFVFDEKYNDEERARKSYTFFLEEYPNHPLADDARNLLAMLQDTTDELEQVKIWMQENTSDTINKQQK